MELIKAKHIDLNIWIDYYINLNTINLNTYKLKLQFTTISEPETRNTLLILKKNTISKEGEVCP